ncbi:hypothetical protein [Micromonospora polyrhachis]|uniref:Uncharacterized protein n=1 Tax=Micromonospora polyrhachis TaxID=1282883 RepID=A0A7W7SNS8_9ACTN|nr:hypothetical protein [Micromonospora polyrhachis]MBB4958153.1 hypothetical protein [Micromonospora polyrhachis]
MPTDIAAAERFIHDTARLLDRHRLAVLLHGAPVEPVRTALRAYQNPDHGFGHALEPDVRDPASQPTATLHALEVLAEVDALDDSMVIQAANWAARNARPDGALPFVLPTAADHPHAPWMTPNPDGSFITFGVASILTRAGVQTPWLDVARSWCWSRIDRPDQLDAYWVKFALDFLDHEPDEDRARAAIASLRPKIGNDGTIPVPGGTEDERLTALVLSPRPHLRSRALFAPEHIDAELDRLETDQLADGGWMFDWLDWSPGQRVEWRGSVTLRALATLAAHGRAR